MPSIAHLVLGGIIGMCLYYISDKKFTKTHVFIFFLSNYLGPDVGWVIGLGYYSHSLVFWPIFALLLSYIYHYFTRFTIKIKGIKKIEIIDLHQFKLNYLNTYFLVLSGGILHNYLDGIMNKEGEFRIIPQISQDAPEFFLSLTDFANFGRYGLIQINIIIVIFVGITFIFGFIFVFTYFIKKDSKKNLIFSLCYILGFLAFFFLVGSLATLYHPDGGAIIYVSIFWGSPLILCVLSTKSFKFLRGKEKKVKDHKYIISYVSLWLLVSGIIFLIISIIGFINLNNIMDYIFTNYGKRISKYFNYNEIYSLILSILIMILVFSLINCLCGFGLLLKNKIFWKITIFYHLIFSWTIIGLLIACALNEKKVKEKFERLN